MAQTISFFNSDIVLGSSIQTVSNYYPDLKIITSFDDGKRTELGIQSFELDNFNDDIKTVGFNFFKKKLYEIFIIYRDFEIEHLNNKVNELLNSLKKDFGKCDTLITSVPGEAFLYRNYHWKYKEDFHIDVFVNSMYFWDMSISGFNIMVIYYEPAISGNIRNLLYDLGD